MAAGEHSQRMQMRPFSKETMKKPEILAKYAQQLADKHRNELGFIPGPAYEEVLALGRLRVAEMNGEPAGFLMHGPLMREVRIHQACVELDARLQDRAKTMVLEMVADALEIGAERVTLHCATELAANDFWGAVGFQHVGIRRARSATRRPANRWEWRLPSGAEIDQRIEELLNTPAKSKLADMFSMKERIIRTVKSRYRRGR